ncbi:MAG: hypothetical protein LBJ43_04465, partial [Propionibacteriaceae bacterium]|nr:hypothetical protein [Propionibacteriaceae bacterium]
IPPKAITPPELNENYSLTEKNTGKKWLNGETIYSKTITYTAPALGSTGTVIIGNKSILSDDLNLLIESETYDATLNGSSTSYIRYRMMNNDIQLEVFIPPPYGVAVNTQLIITFWYTKTTD